MAIEGNKSKLVLAKEVNGEVVTSVSCTPTQLFGIIMHLLDTAAEVTGQSYNDVLNDLKDKNEKEA